MKQAQLFILMFSIISTFSLTLNAQVYVDDVDINASQEIQFIKIKVIDKGAGNVLDVSVDYGQPSSQKGMGKAKLRDSKGGAEMKLNSDIHVLNYFDAHGWKFIDDLDVDSGEGRASAYLMKRKKGK